MFHVKHSKKGGTTVNPSLNEGVFFILGEIVMLDINLFRTDADIIRENIKKKFQDHKLPMVDEIIELDIEYRGLKTRADELRGQRNSLSKEIGKLMGQKRIDEANSIKEQVQAFAKELEEIEQNEEPVFEKLQQLLMQIPNLIADDVPYIFLFNGKYNFYGYTDRLGREKDTYTYDVGYDYWWVAK